MEYKFVHEVCIKSKTNKDQSAEIYPSLLLKQPYKCANTESKKRSAEGSNFKEDDRALPLWELLLHDPNILWWWFMISFRPFDISFFFYRAFDGLFFEMD